MAKPSLTGELDPIAVGIHILSNWGASATIRSTAWSDGRTAGCGTEQDNRQYGNKRKGWNAGHATDLLADRPFRPATRAAARTSFSYSALGSTVMCGGSRRYLTPACPGLPSPPIPVAPAVTIAQMLLV